MNNIYYECLKDTISKHEEIGNRDILIYYKVADRRFDIGYRIEKKIVGSIKEACETVLSNRKIVSRWFTCCHDGVAESILAVHFD